MKMNGAWLAALLAACTTAPSASATPSGSAASPSPAPSAKPAVAAGDFADVAPIAEKTSAGGEVIAVGVPRFQLADGKGFGPLILRSRARLAFAEDAESVAIWDASSGAPLKRIAPRLESYPVISTSLAISDDGEWLATGSSHHVRMFRRPFEQATSDLSCYNARAFSHDGKLLACATTQVAIWDLSKHQLTVPLPSNASKDVPDDVRFSPDNRSLVWTTEHAVSRWDFAGTGAVSPIFQSPGRIDYSMVAEGGTSAYVSAGGKGTVVDLATGKATPVPGQFGAVLSPSGKRLALFASGSLQVLDVATGKPVWSTKVSGSVTRIAFGETDDALAYVEAKRLRVTTIPSMPAALPPSARFVGWLGAGIAAIERGDTLRAFTLATHTWGPADRALLTPKPPDGAPAWARWVVDAPGGAIAAEPSKRHDLGLDRRGVEPCNAKQRVWTKLGGTKTLDMKCTKAELDGHEDPGWEIGGGWAVGVSATAAVVYDARSGHRVASLEVPRRKAKSPDFAPTYWQAALSPAGDWLALIWRRAELQGAHGTAHPDPREDAMHIDEAAAGADCVNGVHGCQLEYFVELWTLKGPPKRVWQTRLERTIPSREMPDAAIPTGPVVFDRTGATLLIGMDDGAILTVATAAPEAPRLVHLHGAPILKIADDLSAKWVWTIDAAGEERMWRLNN